MRGTKLTAWRIPTLWKDLQENSLKAPESSIVPQKQEYLVKATGEVIAAIAKDVRNGLLETVGVESSLSMDECCSVVLELPEKADTEMIARAIDLENVEAWRDSQGKVHVGISPWFSTKDVDQTVLCTIKVIHVLLGIHADPTVQPKTLKQKLIKSLSEIMQIQKDLKK